jgi:hypothetical protein
MFALRNFNAGLRFTSITHRLFSYSTSKSSRKSILEEIRSVEDRFALIDICKKISLDSSLKRDKELWGSLYTKLDTYLKKLTPYQLASIATSLSKSGNGEYLYNLEGRVFDLISDFRDDQLAFVITAYGKSSKGSKELWDILGKRFIENTTEKTVVLINSVFHLMKNDRNFSQYEDKILEILRKKEIDSQGVSSLINASAMMRNEKMFGFAMELFPDHVDSMKDIDFVIALHSISKMMGAIETAPVISKKIFSIRDITGKDAVYLMNALFNFRYGDKWIVIHVQNLVKPKLKELTTRELYNAFHYISSFPKDYLVEGFAESILAELQTRTDIPKDSRGLSSAFHTINKLRLDPTPLIKFLSEETIKSLTGDQLCIVLYSIYLYLPSNSDLIPLLKRYSLLKSSEMHGKHIINMGYVMTSDGYWDLDFWYKFLPSFKRWQDDFILTEENLQSMTLQLFKIESKLKENNLDY